MRSLNEIFKTVRSDKGVDYHNYTPVYQSYFEPFRNDKFVFLELGLGDKTSLNREGEDLLAFQEYFPNAWIVGIDNDVNKLYSDKRIRTYCCDQTDEDKLKEIVKNEGSPFVIIDDCSHQKEPTIKSFEILFPLLKSGGLYCIEDVVAPAYWAGWGGQESIYNSEFMKYFFWLVHQVNLKKKHNFPNPPNILGVEDWIKEIDSIHFHHSQIIIKKK